MRPEPPASFDPSYENAATTLEAALGEVRRTNREGTAIDSDRELQFVANSLIQFVDIEIAATDVAGIACLFHEDSEGGYDQPTLYPIQDGPGTPRHPQSGEPLDPASVVRIEASEALDVLSGRWLPLPYLREGAGGERTDGPANWARCYISRADLGPGGWRIVLAFDTAVSSGASPRGEEVAPSERDIRDEVRFRISQSVEDLDWFASEPWVDDWLRAANSTPAAGAARSPAGKLDYLSRYLTLIDVLNRVGKLPVVRLTARKRSRDDLQSCDLVLDLGSARTTAVLMHTGAGRGTEPLARALPVRDFSEPWRVHAGSMPATCVFQKATFGNEALSRASGRGGAFTWGALVRVGHEAERIAKAEAIDGRPTGLSHPMTQLAEEEPAPRIWRFAGSQPGAKRHAPFVSGALLAYLREDGELLNPAQEPAATKARFSPSSISALVVHDLVLHALAAVDAPSPRATAGRRRLGRLLVAMPLSLHPRERRLLQRRVQAAIDLAWRSLGWAGGTGEGAEIPPKPAVEFVADAASGAIRAFLHNEIAWRFAGQHDDYFELAGRPRARYSGAAAMRVAAIDIGDRSTALSIITAVGSHGSTTEPVLTTECADSAPVGMADVERAVAERFVLPAIVGALRATGMPHAVRFLDGLLAESSDIENPERADLARRLWSDVATKAAARLVGEITALRLEPAAERTVRRLEALVGPDVGRVAQAFDDLATMEGAAGFSLASVPVACSQAEVMAAIGGILLATVRSAARVVRALDCDWLVLAGFGAKLSVVRDTITAQAAVRADRIVSLDTYRFGPWMPNRDATGRVGDVRLATTIGSALPYLSATGQAAANAAIGIIDKSGLVRADRIAFEVADSEDVAARVLAQEYKVTFEGQTTLGRRRIDTESWPATPIYDLRVNDKDAVRRAALPLEVTIGWEATRSARAEPVVRRIQDARGRSLPPSLLSLTFTSGVSRPRPIAVAPPEGRP